MTASRSFENKSFGKIIKGQIIPNRVLKNMNVQDLIDAKFIFDETDKEVKDEQSNKTNKKVVKK